MTDSVFEKKVLERLSRRTAAISLTIDSDFIQSAFRTRTELEEIVNRPETITSERWIKLLNKGEIAINKAIASCELAPYELIEKLCAHRIDENIVPDLLSRPLEEKQLEKCVKSNRGLFNKLVVQQMNNKDKIIIHPNNIEILAKNHIVDGIGHSIISLVKSRDTLDAIIKATKELNTGETSLNINNLDEIEESIVDSITTSLLKNPNITIDEKMEIIDNSKLGILSDERNVPDGLEELAYQIHSLNFFNNPEGDNAKASSDLISTLLRQGRFTETMEIDLINNLKNANSCHLVDCLKTTFFENFKSQEGLNYFLDSLNENNIDEYHYYFTLNKLMDKQYLIDFLKFNRETIDTYLLMNQLENSGETYPNRDTINSDIIRTITALERYNATTLKQINIDEFKEEEGFLMDEYRRLIKSYDAYRLTDQFFSRSANTPISFLQEPPLNKFICSELNIAFRNNNIPAEYIDMLLAEELFPDYLIDDAEAMLPYSYLIKVTDILNEISKKYQFETNNKELNDINKAKVKAISDILDIITPTDFDEKAPSLNEESKEIFGYDTFNFGFRKTITKNFNEELLIELINKYPTEGILSAMKTAEIDFLYIKSDPKTFISYIDSYEKFYNILNDNLNKRKEINIEKEEEFVI